MVLNIDSALTYDCWLLFWFLLLLHDYYDIIMIVLGWELYSEAPDLCGALAPHLDRRHKCPLVQPEAPHDFHV